jgi:hypothetical protein
MVDFVNGTPFGFGVNAPGTFVPPPLMHMPLESDLSLRRGVGSATFTRATEKRFVDKDDGLIKVAAIDVAAFEASGVLIEGASTNLLLRSEEFDNAAWGKTASSVSADTDTDPSGSVTADKLVEDNTLSGHAITQAITPLSATAYTLSVYLKKSTRDFGFVGLNGGGSGASFISVNLNTGVLSSAIGSPNATIRALTNGWFRVSVTITTSSTASLSSDVRLSEDGIWDNRVYAGDGSSGFFLWGAQLEALPFPPSYIPTTTTSVTRALDDNSVDPSNIPAPTEPYTIHTVLDILGLDSTKSQILFNVDGETTRRIAVNTTTGLIEATHGAVTSVSTTAITPGTPMEITFTVGGTNQTLYIDKAQEDQDVKGTVTGTATRISLGNNAGSDQVFANFKPITIFREALTDAQQATL